MGYYRYNFLGRFRNGFKGYSPDDFLGYIRSCIGCRCGYSQHDKKKETDKHYGGFHGFSVGINQVLPFNDTEKLFRIRCPGRNKCRRS